MIDGVHFAGKQGIHAGGNIVDAQHLYLIEIRTSRLPVIHVALQFDGYAGLVFHERVTAGSNRLAPIQLASSRWANDEMEIGA